MDRYPVISRQPFKAIYTVLVLAKTIPHIAVLSLLYLVKPRYPGWTMGTSLYCAIVQRALDCAARTRSHYIMGNDVTKATNLVAIEPLGDDFFSGVLTPTAEVKPATVHAVWFPSLPWPQKADNANDKTVLYFHGGAFVMSVGHKIGGTNCHKLFAKHVNATRFLWVQYRVASDKSTCFPAAVQDALSCYNYVVSLGIAPSNIVLSGDSAGGNIVLALLRHLEAWPKFPLPSGALLFSPWLHVTSSAREDFEKSPNSKHDCLTGDVLQWGADMYLPCGKESLTSQPYTSPLHHPFKTSVPLFIQAGSAEGFFHDIQCFTDEMKAVSGNRIHLEVVPGAFHDTILATAVLGFDDFVVPSLKEARRFFNW